MKLPPEQQAIRDKCFHPLGTYMEFPKEDVETSKAARFEKIVSQYPVGLVVKTGNCAFTQQELHQRVNGVVHVILDHREPGGEPIAFMYECRIYQITAILASPKGRQSLWRWYEISERANHIFS